MNDPHSDILFVCTGNICRSAFAHRWMAARCPDSRIASGGTHTSSRASVPFELVEAAADVGVDLRSWASTQLTIDHVRAARLILVAAREHRAWVLKEHPAALGRTFLITEFASILQGSRHHSEGPTLSLGQLTDRAHHRRSSGTPVDIPDPYGGPAGGYLQMVHALLPSLNAIAAQAGFTVE